MNTKKVYRSLRMDVNIEDWNQTNIHNCTLAGQDTQLGKGRIKCAVNMNDDVDNDDDDNVDDDVTIKMIGLHYTFLKNTV